MQLLRSTSWKVERKTYKQLGMKAPGLNGVNWSYDYHMSVGAYSETCCLLPSLPFGRHQEMLELQLQKNREVG